MVQTLCYTVFAYETTQRRGKDSRWIRVWPETANANIPLPSLNFTRWLLWLEGWSIGTFLAVQQQLDRDPLDLKRTKALLKPGIHDADRAYAHPFVSADTLSSNL